MRLVKLTVLFIMLFGWVDASAQRKKNTKESEPAPVEVAPPAEPKPAETKTIDPLLQHFYKKYALASRWNDAQVAKDALYDMIAINPESDSIIFNLAYFYYENRQYASATLVSQELLARNAKNQDYLELSAASFEALGILDRSLQNYETLYLLTNSTLSLYKIAFMQFDLKRYEESLTNVEILLTKPDLDKYDIGFNDSSNKQKDFPMKLAILNLKGLNLQAKGDKATAKKIFQDIIKEAPDFQPAITNLAELNKG
ncbi:MAG: hypothetical protein KDC93_14275 [Cyclobacteriaceae bacterium]|nr:hypothetical protein [Cyclobacteriaceae bacterium]